MKSSHLAVVSGAVVAAVLLTTAGCNNETPPAKPSEAQQPAAESAKKVDEKNPVSATKPAGTTAAEATKQVKSAPEAVNQAKNTAGPKIEPVTGPVVEPPKPPSMPAPGATVQPPMPPVAVPPDAAAGPEIK